MNAIFIGVVSHERTSRPKAQGPEGLAQRLGAELRGMGSSVTIRINTEDLLDHSGIHVTDQVVAASSAEELRIEKKWAHYLGIYNSLGWRTTHLLRWLRYWVHTYWRRSPRPVTRLINIELSHRNLLQQSVTAGADWILILEDDAECSNISDLATGLHGIMNGTAIPDMVNLSRSFTAEELRVDHLLYPADSQPWIGTESRTILAATKPVTNTVCANLYRGGFAKQLARELSELPLVPVAPIDWKLNLALMNLFDQRHLGSGDCWWVEPAPITQGSMHQS